ncbi:hypothetical protein NPIL_518061, partial [Nephila pilipes]
MFSVQERDAFGLEKGTQDGYIWECRKRGESAHSRRSLRKNYWFEESNLSIIEILLMINMWVQKANHVFIAFEVGVSRGSFMDWMSFCQEA